MGWLVGVLLLLGITDTLPFQIFLPFTSRIEPGAKGVAFDYASCDDVRAVGASWAYAYGPGRIDCGADIDIIPMIYSDDKRYWPDYQPAALLVFNEPDLSQQANVAPEQAAASWPEVERRYPRAWLIGPNISQRGLDWLDQWYGLASVGGRRAPRISALAGHCYNDVNGCKAFVRALEERAKAWGIGEVWLTEFAFMSGDGADRTAEAAEVIGWLKSEPLVKRWAWWTNRPCNGEPWCPANATPLVDRDGALTAYGRMYWGQ
jgi:hypothetical protein